MINVSVIFSNTGWWEYSSLIIRYLPTGTQHVSHFGTKWRCVCMYLYIYQDTYRRSFFFFFLNLANLIQNWLDDLIRNLFSLRSINKDSMDMSLSKLWEIVKDWADWCTVVHGVAKCCSQFSKWTATTAIALGTLKILQQIRKK